MYEKQDHIKIYFMLILALVLVLDMDQQVAKKMTKLYSVRQEDANSGKTSTL